MKLKTKRKKIILDTSIQIERIKNPDFDKLIRQRASIDDLHTSFFVLYEFKVGFIRSVIDYYIQVELATTVADAKSRWSNNFSVRDLKNKEIIESVMFRLYTLIETNNKKDYLRKLEASIWNTIQIFSMQLKGHIGSFQNDEIVKFAINSEADYKEFIKLCSSRKTIPQNKFWTKNLDALKALIAVDHAIIKPAKTRDAFKKIHDCLVKIEADLTKADDANTNKPVGDAVISTDCPSSFTILTSDNVFNILCPTLNKKHEVIARLPIGSTIPEES